MSVSRPSGIPRPKEDEDGQQRRRMLHGSAVFRFQGSALSGAFFRPILFPYLCTLLLIISHRLIAPYSRTDSSYLIGVFSLRMTGICRCRTRTQANESNSNVNMSFLTCQVIVELWGPKNISKKKGPVGLLTHDA